MKSGSNIFLKIGLASTLIANSQLALAASVESSWMTYMYIGVAISIVVATVLSIRNKSAGTVGLKIMLGGVYFWVVAFIQLILFAAVSYFRK